MKKVIIILVIIVSFSALARAQDSTRLERIGYVLGSSALFGLADYYAWNSIHHPRVFLPYRLVQGTVQAAITYFLYRKFGLSSAISFTCLWWSWCDDLAYYGWANTLNSFSWEGRTWNGLKDSEINWAGWTPIGLLRPQGSLIARNALIAQAVIGFSVSMAILW
jgi:hypothetical protein